VFPKCIPAHCCQHIADSVQSRFGVKCRPLFWKCVWAKTKEQFQEALKALKAEKVIAAAYVDNIPHKLWARYAFPASRYGHYTSNIVESLNSVWGQLRYLPPLKMVDGIWTTVMKTFHDRLHRPHNSSCLPDTVYLKFQDRLKSSRRYKAFESGNSVY
jgi:hypothetical protein